MAREAKKPGKKEVFGEVVKRRFASKQRQVKEVPEATGSDTGSVASYKHFSPIPVTAIEPNPEQPRVEFDQGELEQLAASIREHGLWQPISVVEVAPGRYQLIAGERRWRAFKLLGKERIEALVYPPSQAPKDPQIVALIENTNRADLTPVERAEAVLELFRREGLADSPEELRWMINRLHNGYAETSTEQRAQELFQLLGLSLSGFRKRALGTLFWPEELRALVRAGEIRFRAAAVVARAAKDEELYGVLLDAARGGASEAELKRLLRTERAKKTKAAIPEHMERNYYAAVAALRGLTKDLDPEFQQEVQEFIKKLKERVTTTLKT